MSGALATWLLAFRLARRELRQAAGGIWLIVLCLVLGVTAIATLGNLSASLRGSLAANARTILGGDIEARMLYRPADDPQLKIFQSLGDVTSYIELRSMARRIDQADQRLVELKVIDDTYPALGQAVLDTGEDLQQALTLRDGVWGAVAEQAVYDRLGVKTGDEITLGAGTFQLRGVLKTEPDRLSSGFILGPRVMIGRAAFGVTGFDQPGSLAQYVYKIRFRDQAAQQNLDRVRDALTGAGWRLREPDNATPQLRRFIDRFGLFLTLVGLGALLLGGIGVAQATEAYLDRRRRSVAIMKCVGAAASLILKIYLAATVMMGAVGVAAGVGLAAIIPPLLEGLLGDLFALPVRLRPDLLASLWAASVGFATILLYTCVPLLRARHQPAASLFRAAVLPDKAKRWREEAIALLLAGGLFGGLILLTAQDRLLAAAFLVGALVTGLSLRFMASGLQSLARRGRTIVMGIAARLALQSMGRPGSALPSVVMALGFGMTVLVAVLQIDNNMRRELAQSLPSRAPSFFFLDIQPDQVQPFAAAVRQVDPQAVIESTPMLRGRITAINGTEVDKLPAERQASWVLQGDRGITWSPTLPANTRLVAGQWWPTPYQGMTQVSFDAEAASNLGIGLGDQITVNVLGRTFEATVTSLSEVDWSAMNINFVMVFSPGILDKAPNMQLATVRTLPDKEIPIEKSVSGKLANVTVIRVKEALAEATRLLGTIGLATRLTAAVAVLVGMLVLAGAVLVGMRRRIDDAAVMKMLGARRRTLIGATLVEYALAGVIAALIASLFGSAASALFTHYMLEFPWYFSPLSVLSAIILAGGFAVIAGVAVLWPVLRLKPSAMLRRI